jgi:hypothetical protein
VFPPDINAGSLRSRCDVLVFNNESLGVAPAARAGGAAAGRPAALLQVRRSAGTGGGAAAQDVAPGDDRPRPFQPILERYTRRQAPSRRRASRP